MNKGKEDYIHNHDTKKRSGNINYREHCYFHVGFQYIQNQAADLGVYILTMLSQGQLGLPS